MIEAGKAGRVVAKTVRGELGRIDLSFRVETSNTNNAMGRGLAREIDPGASQTGVALFQTHRHYLIN